MTPSLSSFLPSWLFQWSNEDNDTSRSSVEAREDYESILLDSELYDACLEMNWSTAETLCEQRPNNAKYQEGDNLETPLYMACQNNPPLSTVRALLKANPKAVLTKSRRGDLPINMACRYGASVEVIRALVEQYPVSACQRTRWGSTALTSLYEGQQGSPILQIMSSLDRNGDISQNLALFSALVRIEGSIYLVDDDTDHEARRRDFFTKADILIEAVARHRQQKSGISSSSNNKILFMAHAVVSLGSTSCPLLFLFYVAAKFKEQFLLRDHQGRLPLHIAVGPDNSSDPRTLWKFKPREFWAIQLSLTLYPDSATIRDPITGYYPLHTALMYGHEWNEGVRELVKAAPRVLHIPDPVQGLYPFQLIATKTSSISTDDRTNAALTTCYQLLRSDPNVLEHFCISGWVESSSATNNVDTAAIGPDASQHQDNENWQKTPSLFVLGLSGLVVALIWTMNQNPIQKAD